jgi:RNA polymerase sigma factor (sigma-70 family)
MDNVQQETDRLYKQHFSKLMAGLLYSSRDIDPETAEDIVQDAFSAALTDWRKQGIPVNPAGWLYRVCRNKALNKIKRDQRTEPLSEKTEASFSDSEFSESILDDQQLKLLFACAHPDLSPKTQIAITLKYVLNLRVDAIAHVLAMSIDGVDKLLVRARQKIKDEQIVLEEPHPRAFKQRLPIVHKIIYLTFNEGYKSSGGKELLREELCEEALLLNKSLIDHDLGDLETLALQALMLFNSARLKSRFGVEGELMDLENQDRSRWNQELILLGQDFFSRSRTENLSAYHLEAAIACVHCVSKSFAETDWKTIAALYARLLNARPNPFADLGYAVALYYAGEAAASFKILNELQQHPFLHRYYLLNMTLGKFHHLEGNDVLALDFMQKACDQTKFIKEKEFILNMMNKIKNANRS